MGSLLRDPQHPPGAPTAPWPKGAGFATLSLVPSFASGVFLLSLCVQVSCSVPGSSVSLQSLPSGASARDAQLFQCILPPLL